MGKTREELAYCGVDCGECNIYRASHYGEAIKPETLRRWREDARQFWGVDNLEEENLDCRGCRTDKKDVFFGFTLCPIRKCSIARGLNSCGACPDWEECAFYESVEEKENIKRLAGMEG